MVVVVVTRKTLPSYTKFFFLFPVTAEYRTTVRRRRHYRRLTLRRLKVTGGRGV